MDGYAAVLGPLYLHFAQKITIRAGMAQTFLVKIKDQIGLHTVRVSEPQDLSHVLDLYGIAPSSLEDIREIPDQPALGLDSIWAA